MIFVLKLIIATVFWVVLFWVAWQLFFKKKGVKK